ncbi:MAG: hypothetical protein NVSMB52_07050 [Chloroflexota bacterium]
MYRTYMPRKSRFRNVGAGKGVKERLDAATLRKLYLEDSMSQAEIGLRFDCSPQYVSLLVREYGLSRAPRLTSHLKRGKI